MSVKDTNYCYEVKCRRCGKLTELVAIEKTSMRWVEWAAIMEREMMIKSMECEACTRYTIHDLVSYTGPY